MRTYFSLFLVLINLGLQGQVAKKSVVEHFTNSNCSVCFNTNPGIYSTLQANPSALHITFHPSSPYSSCFFSLQNPTENDGRTNYYGIYGSTPKLIVNGVQTAAAGLSSTLQNAANDSSSFQVYATQQFISPDSVNVTVVIKKVAADFLSGARLFIGAYQDTVLQLTGNGESIHQDVFRKELANNQIILPTIIGDSAIHTKFYSIPGTWVASKMNSLVILQHNNTKTVIQSATSTNVPYTPVTTSSIQKVTAALYPNPCADYVIIKGQLSYTTYNLYTLDGKKIESGSIRNNKINVEHLVPGNYSIIIFGTNLQHKLHFIKR